VCGFVGVYSNNESGGVAERDLCDATRLLAHRGPDDEAYYRGAGFSAGFRRLKILDLSDKGRQPMADETGRYQIVFNGEIYNYRELRETLRQEGRCFRSQTDTEVLLNAYLHWGTACLARLNGMFAFLIWDQHERSLFGARDRFGEKPLYHVQVPDGFWFASEIKALIRLLRKPPNFRPAVIHNYLQNGVADLVADTFFEGIGAVPAAHQLTVANGKLLIEPYWRLEASERSHGDPITAFRDLFLDSVRLRTRSDVPVGTCLSGGLDSAAIVCSLPLVMGEASSQMTRKTFTANYLEFDERVYVDQVNRQSGSTGYTITPEPSSLESLEEMLWFHDEPFHSFGPWAGYEVMRLARSQGVVVLLNGQGADELLGGYPSYLRYYLADLLQRGSFGRAIASARRARSMAEATAVRSLAAAVSLAFRKSLGRPFVKRRSGHGQHRRRRAAMDRCVLLPDFLDAAEQDPVAEVLSPISGLFKRELHLTQIGSHLPLYLRVEDRNSMAHSIESRLPFLDHRLAELVFSMEPGLFMDHGKNKFILRKAMEGILPDEVRNRSAKFGFPVPQVRWIYHNLREPIQDMLRVRNLGDGIFNAARLQARFDADLSAENSAAAGFWFRVVSFLLWWQARRTNANHRDSSSGSDAKPLRAPQLNDRSSPTS
jgi:asparagine synthase (glutamine-hydrolysing)